MTGNKDRDLVVDPALVSLVVCIIIYPQVQLDEIAMYLYNNGAGLYSNQLTSQRLKELQITNKKPSIEAFKAYSPANMRRELLFWNIQLPIGVVGIPRNKMAESAQFLGNCVRQVRTVGNYEKGQKLTVMIAVEPGDPELPVDYGPIEYVICQLLNHMKVSVTGELDLNQMEQQILVSAAAIGPFNATFAHCRYSEDGVYPGVEIPINLNADPPGWGPLGPPGAG
eukprot:jgi/Psemu1/54190/gm1.54190_g